VPADACRQLLLQLAWQQQQQQQGLRLLLALLVLLPHLLLLLALAHQLQLLPLAWLPALNLLLLLQAVLAAAMTQAQWHLSHTDQRLIPTRHLNLLQQQRPPHPAAAAAVVQPYQLPLARFLAVGAYAPAPLVRTLQPTLRHLVITRYS
jgi:hypothetical protein